jgi:hypothetical protein
MTDLGASKGGASLSMTAASKTTAGKKMAPGPQRLLKEADINSIYDSLCDKCKKHCDGFVHLTCGREGQHVMGDIEINELIAEINKSDLLELLVVEKGSTAKMMIETIKLKEPDEIMYTEEHVRELVKDLETDYYERYEFDDLQKMILEDRRLRVNYWIAQIIHKPIEKFKNPNLLNKNEKVNRTDIKNPYFSLQRNLPISLHMDKYKVVEKDERYDKLHFVHTSKLQQNEQDLIIQRTMMKEMHRVAPLGEANNKDTAVNTLLLRNYNDGRTGGWDNYSCYKGQNKGTYVPDTVKKLNS